MSRADDIQVTVEVVNGATILRPQGEVDLSRAPSLRVQLDQAQANAADRLIIDLTNVPYMDSSGVATLVEAMQVARRENRKLILCALQDRVRSIFEIARLDMVFTIVASADDAMSV